MTYSPVLEVKDLQVTVEGERILSGLNLVVQAGEIHAIMGPNGSGKSTFAKVVAGHPLYQLESGCINHQGCDLENITAEERAQRGIFMGFQYPVEIPGVTNSAFLRLALNSARKAKNLEELDPIEFDDFVRDKLETLEIDPSFLDRSVNGGFSGGEKKRNEILQMAILEPRLAILDETDSGLDIDALRIVANGINKLANKNNAVVLITHYQRLLNYIKPDYVHVMHRGAIVKTGSSKLALELEADGYDRIIEG